MFQKHFRKHTPPENIDSKNFEENLFRVLKNSRVIRTGTSNYQFIRLLSKSGFDPILVYSKTLREMFSPQPSPQTTPKGSPLQKLRFVSPMPTPESSPTNKSTTSKTAHATSKTAHHVTKTCKSSFSTNSSKKART